MSKVDITDSVSDELRAEVLEQGTRLYRLELGTLMLRHPQTLDTRFFHDEADTAGQLLHGKLAQRRGRP